MALFKTVSICGRANYQIAYAEVYMNRAGRKLIGYNKELFSVIQRKLATIPIWPHLTKCLTVLRRHLRLTQRRYSLTQLHQASTIALSPTEKVFERKQRVKTKKSKSATRLSSDEMANNLPFEGLQRVIAASFSD